MKHTEPFKTTTTQTRVVMVTCDRCGADMTASKPPRDSWLRPLVRGSSFMLTFGYGSRFDMDERSYDLCDDCCEWLASQMTEATRV